MPCQEITRKDNPPIFECSVVIPCYNCANTIGACIASIIAQTLKPKEVIAIDDGSRDNTLELLLALQKEYQEEVNIEVIHQENSGPSKARNEGIRKAKCEWIAFLDSDDAWHPQALEVARWSWLQSVDIALISGKSRDLLPLEPLTYNTDQLSIRTIPYRELLKRNFFTTSSVVCKKEVLAQFLFDETQKYSEDYKLWLDICYNYRVCQTDAVTSYTINGARLFGTTGLSSHMYDMWLGEVSNYKHQKKLKRISLLMYLCLVIFSYLKLLRRYVLVHIKKSSH